jgi:hypothetical protein
MVKRLFMSCSITSNRKFLQEIKELSMYDNVKITESDKSVQFVSLVDIYISNNNEKGECVYFNSTVEGCCVKEIVEYFSTLTDESLEYFINIVPDCYYIPQPKMKTLDEIEDAYLHFVEKIIKKVDEIENIDFETYSYKGFRFRHLHTLFLSSDTINSYRDSGCSALKLYDLFDFELELEYLSSIDAFTVNYRTGCFKYKYAEEQNFSICDESLIADMRKITGISKDILIDEKSVILEACVEYLIAVYDNADAKKILKIATISQSLKEFKEELDKLEKCNSCGGVRGISHSITFWYKSDKKPDFQLTVYNHLKDLIKTENDEYFKYDEVGGNIELFNSLEHDIFKLVWSYYNKGIFTIRSRKKIDMKVEINKEYNEGRELQKMKKKIESGEAKSLLDLMI